MTVHHKTKAELIVEVEALRQRVTELQDQSRNEEGQQASEGPYHQLFDALFNTHLDAVFILDQNGRFLDANQVAQEQYGYTRDELLEMNINVLSALELRDKVPLRFQESLRNRSVYEWRHRHKDGSEFPVEICVVPFTFQGKPVVLATVHDISEHKKAEIALRESEERFRAIVTSMDDIVYTLDSEQRHTGVYGNWVERNGMRQEFFLGKTAREILGPEASRIHEKNNERALAGERVVYEWMLPINGYDRYYQTVVSPIHGEDGSRYGLVGVGREITELRMAEKTLRENKTRFSNIITSAMDAIISVDTGQHIVLFNSAAEKMFGYQASEIIGKPLTMLIPERFRERHEKLVYAFGKTRVTNRSMGNLEPVFGVDKNGREFPIEASISQHEEHGQHLYTVILRDITDRQQAEEARRILETRVQTVMDTMIGGGQIIGFDWRYLYVNETVVAQSGYASRDDLIGFTMMEKYPGIKQMEAFKALQQCMENRIMQRLETEFTFPDGSTGWFDLAVHPVPEGIFILSYDITDRKRTEDALRESENRLRMATTAGNVSIWEWDVINNKVTWDENLYVSYGMRKEDISEPYEAWLRTIHPDDLAYVQQSIAATMSGENDKTMEFRIVRPDGEVRTMWSSAQLYRDEWGKVVRLIGTNIDITQRKQAEVERKAQEIQMIEDQRLKSLGLLAGGVAHDINNLLTPIGLNIEIMRMAHAPTPKARQLLQSLENATQKIGDIVQQMLVYAGRGEPALGKMDLNKLVEDIYTLLHASLPKNVDFQLDLTTKSLPMQGDRTQLEQVLMNLILNASEAFAGQGGQVVISTSRQSEEEVVLKVRDNGPGIDDENLGRIFDPFFSTKVPGRGLGLSAVQGIIIAHSGEITVDTKVGEGTTFTIRLPLTRSGPDTDPDVADTEALPFRGGKWLMIDDEDIVRQTTCEALKIMGLEMIDAASGEIGLKMVDQYAELAGVLLDLTMPGMSGREVFEQLRGAYPDLPVVIASGYSEQVVQDLLTQPNVAFISKPFNIYKLEQTMRSLMGGG